MRLAMRKYTPEILVGLAVISAALAVYHLCKLIFPPQLHLARHGVYAAVCLVNVYGFLKRPYWFEIFWWLSSTILFVGVHPTTAEDWPHIFSVPFLVYIAFTALVTVLLELDSNAPSKRSQNS